MSRSYKYAKALSYLEVTAKTPDKEKGLWEFVEGEGQGRLLTI